MIARSVFSGGAPSLQYIRLRGIALQTCLPPLKIVTNLRVEECFLHRPISPREFSFMLSGLSALTHLVLREIYLDAVIELPSLRSLHVLIYSGMLPKLLDMISFF